MPRYIDVDALLITMGDRYDMLVKDYGQYDAYAQGYDEAITLIEETPTSDVQEVQHGNWTNRKDSHTCSRCKEILYIETHGDEWGSQGVYEYCPYCGARMDGDDGETDC